MLRKITMLVAMAACALAAVGSSASANTFLHATTTTGNTLNSGTTLTSGLLSGSGGAVLTTTAGTVTCTTAGFTGTTNSNSGGATVTGNLAANAAGLFFGAQSGTSTCSDTIPLLNVTKCAQTASPGAPVVATATGSTGGSLNLTSVTVSCTLNAGGPCVFVGRPANGAYTNSDHTVRYSNVPVTSSTGFPCPASGTFTAAFGPVVVSGGTFAGQPVVMNTTA